MTNKHTTELKPRASSYYSAIPACEQRCQAAANPQGGGDSFRVREHFFCSLSCFSMIRRVAQTLCSFACSQFRHNFGMTGSISSIFHTRRAYSYSFDWGITWYKSKIHFLIMHGRGNRARVADFYDVHHAHVCTKACGGLDSVHVS